MARRRGWCGWHVDGSGGGGDGVTADLMQMLEARRTYNSEPAHWAVGADVVEADVKGLTPTR